MQLTKNYDYDFEPPPPTVSFDRPLSVTKREYEHLRLPDKNAMNVKCGCENCTLCNYNIIQTGTKSFTSKYTKFDYRILHKCSCTSTWVIYQLICKKCGAAYIGSTEQTAETRTKNHLTRMSRADTQNLKTIESDEYIQGNLYTHFKLGCMDSKSESNNNNNNNNNKFDATKDIGIIIIERVVKFIKTRNPYHISYVAKARNLLNLRERYWQAECNLVHTEGLNDTKDFNNFGYFRRNTPVLFVNDYKIFKNKNKFKNNEICDTNNDRNKAIKEWKEEMARECKMDLNTIENLTDVLIFDTKWLDDLEIGLAAANNEIKNGKRQEKNPIVTKDTFAKNTNKNKNNNNSYNINNNNNIIIVLIIITKIIMTMKISQLKVNQK